MTPHRKYEFRVMAHEAAPQFGTISFVRGGCISVTALIACALAGLMAAASSPQEMRQTVADPEEYAVYAAVLKARYLDGSVKRYVFAAETNSEDKTAFIGYRMGITFSGAKRPEVELETSVDFNAKGKEPCQLNDKLTLPVPYSLVTESDLRKVFDGTDQKLNQAGWNDFYKKYPGAPGAISFSRVGFNAKKDQALLYVARQAGFVNGSGRYFVLSRKGDAWKIEKEVIMWLS